MSNRVFDPERYRMQRLKQRLVADRESRKAVKRDDTNKGGTMSRTKAGCVA